MGKVGSADAKPQVKVKTPTPEVTTPVSPPSSKPELSASTKGKLGLKDRFTKTQAAFQPKADAPAPKESVLRDVSDPKARALLASVSQVNDISRGYGNHNDICGAASAVATLVLESGEAGSARANADALGAGYKRALNLIKDDRRADLDATLTPGVETALAHLASRTLSQDDVAFLQQATYLIGRAVPGTDEQVPGLSTGAMGSIIADLKGSGANFGSGTTFSQVHDKVGGHWVAQHGSTFINTADKDSASGKLTAKSVKNTAADFSGRVRLLPNGDVELQTRTRRGEEEKPKTPGLGYQTTLTPIDPRNDVQRAFAGNDKRLDADLSRAIKGKLAD